MTKRILSDVQVTTVSFVDKGANQRSFFLTKSADQNDQRDQLSKEIKLVSKSEDAQKIAYGVVYEPDVEDSHGDMMNAEEIEKSAHYFMQYQQIDKQHNNVGGYGQVVESYIAPADLEISGETITKGSWVMAVKASDEVWEEIQKGEVTGFSLAGLAKVEVVEKSVTDRYNQTILSRNIFAAFSALECELWNTDINSTQMTKIIDDAKEFVSILEAIARTDNPQEIMVQMADEVKKSEAEELDKEAIAKAIASAVSNLTKQEGTE